MSIYEYDEEKQREFDREEGRAEGKVEGESRFAMLTKLLLEQGKLEELKRATEDNAYKELLYKEFAL